MSDVELIVIVFEPESPSPEYQTELGSSSPEEIQR